jgi:outer membrane protein assembly factor BamB
LLAWLAFYGIRGFDHQNANIAFLLMNALAIVFGVLWWLVRSSPSLAIRLLLLTAPVIGLPVFFQFFEFRGFSGELVPQFRWQSRLASPLSPPPSEPLANKDVRSDLKSLESTASFRQFLGNERTGFVEDIHLSERWDQNQPKLLWKRSIGLGWSGFAIQNGLAITMDEFDGRDCLIALDWNDGSLRWRAPLARRHYHPMGGGGPSATPTIEGKQVYAQSSTGIICSCDVDSGKILWQVDLLEKAGISQKEAELAVTWGRSGSPLLYGELLIVPFGGAMEESPAGLIALDRSSGRERWRGGSAQISYASPSMMTIRGVEQIVVVNESTVTGHNPEWP